MNVLKDRLSSLPETYGPNLDAEYRRHEFITPTISNTNLYATATPALYNVSGDHLYIHSIDGAGCIQIRFNEQAPWIDVEIGMELKRNYDKIYIRDVSLYTGKIIPYTRVSFYTSFGPLATRLSKLPGIRAGFIGFTGNLVADTWTDINSLLDVNSDLDGYFIGGPILIKVAAASASPLSIAYSYIGIPLINLDRTSTFILDAGEYISFDYDGRITNAKGIQTVFGATTCERMSILFCPTTAATTATVRILCNRRAMLTEPQYMTDNKLQLITIGT